MARLSKAEQDRIVAELGEGIESRTGAEFTRCPLFP